MSSNIKLCLCKSFSTQGEISLRKWCKNYDRLLFKFRSGKHGLNDELGMHIHKCLLCGTECEKAVHVRTVDVQ